MGVTWVDWRSIRIPPPTERVDPPFTFQRSSTIRSVLWPPTGPLHENPLQGSSSVHKKKLTSNLRPKIKLRLKRLSLDRMKLLHNEVIFFSVYDHKLVDFGGQIEERRQYFADTDVTVSSLLIEQAHLGHSGNYTCQPAHCPPSSARIHILKGSDGGFSTCSLFFNINWTLFPPLVDRWTAGRHAAQFVDDGRQRCGAQVAHPLRGDHLPPVLLSCAVILKRYYPLLCINRPSTKNRRGHRRRRKKI